MHEAVLRVRGDLELFAVRVLESRRAAINRRDDDRAEVLDLLGVRREVCFVIVLLRLPARLGLGLGLHSRGRLHDDYCLRRVVSRRVCAVVGRCWMTRKRTLDGVRERVLCCELALNKAELAAWKIRNRGH